MKESYILSLDQGTTSSRAILFNNKGELIGIEQKELKQIFPQQGWVEQDPISIYNSQREVIIKLLSKLKINPKEIAAIGITNQRETTILWDKNTGEPVYNAIVWQDKRTADYCNKLKAGGIEKYIKENTGLLIDSYFSATKIYWILNNVPEAKIKALNGDLLFGTVDTWLIWKFSNGKLHITDHSNASRTLLYNLHTKKWDNKLLNLFDIPATILPNIVDSSQVYGSIVIEEIGTTPIVVSGIAGDQQAALFGQLCLTPGTAKNTYGTGCFMLMNIGEKIKLSQSGLLTTVAWKIGDSISYAFEGSVFNAGSAINWLRDSLSLLEKVEESEQMALSLKNNEGVYFIPAFSGLGTPHWNMEARGTILGLTQKCDKRHIIRATLESIAYQSLDVFMAMEKDSGIELELLNVDGGASNNNFLMQFQSDILQKKVVKPSMIESTALGAAFLAALAVKFWTIDEIKEIKKSENIFTPNMDEIQREQILRDWKNAIATVNHWSKL